MKKILHIVEAMGGGVFTYLVSLTNTLCEEYEVYVAYATRPQTPENYKDYFNGNVHLIEVKSFSRRISIIKDLKSFMEINRIRKELEPDIVHLHSSKAGVLGRLAFMNNNVVFYTPHCYSFSVESNRYKKKVFKLIETTLGKLMCNCTTIACSESEYIETKNITRRAKYVSNGIDIKHITGALEKFHGNSRINGKFVVFTIGRVCEQKNPKMFNRIAERLPHIHFLWIGDGERRNELRSPNIQVTGWLEYDDAICFANSADVYLSTSYAEGLPIALLESMYMKKTCVVSNVRGNYDVIQNRINGYLCDSQEEFVAAIQECYSNKPLQLINRAFNQIISTYNSEAMAKRYVEIYEGRL